MNEECKYSQGTELSDASSLLLSPYMLKATEGILRNEGHLVGGPSVQAQVFKMNFAK